MAAAIPAGIGLGSSIIGGVQGKGAAKKQEKLAREQMAMLKPLIDAQIAASQFALGQAQQYYPQAGRMFGETYDTAMGDRQTAMTDYRQLLDQALGRSTELYNEGKGLTATGRDLLGQSQNYLTGASTALTDLQKFFRPFMEGGATAIDRFLPSAARTNELMAPEYGNINQGYRSASENLARFAPRGGGRVSTMARADIDRQKQLSDVFFQGRQALQDKSLGAAFQGAAGQQQVANSLQSLGLGTGQLGLGTIGQGLNTIGTGTQILGTEGGLAQNAFGQGLQALGLGINSAQGIGNLATSSLSSGLSGGQGVYDLYNRQADRSFNAQFGGSGGGGSQGGLGGFLVDLFSNPSIQKKLGDLFKRGGGTSAAYPDVNLGIGGIM